MCTVISVHSRQAVELQAACDVPRTAFIRSRDAPWPSGCDLCASDGWRQGFTDRFSRPPISSLLVAGAVIRMNSGARRSCSPC